MDASTWAQILGAAAAIVGGFWGGIKIYRDSQHATRATAVDGFNRLVSALEIRLANVELDLTRAHTRIEVLEGQSETDQAEIQALRSYVAYLQRFIGQHAPGISPQPMQDSRRTEP